MWTEAQKSAIEKKGNNILVSAAAGSGKTAVLTERILTKIVSGQTQADRLVVVTFTKAAAAEMRERIRKGLEERLRMDPSNRALFVQMTLLADADICTIDSFCNKLVKTHFEEAGIDPAFRIPEEAELSLLKSDVFSAVIEEFYREGSEDFFEFISAFSSAKNDSDAEAIINNVYEESLNKPWPDEWLDKCIEMSSVSEPDKSPVLQAHLNRIKYRLGEYVTAARAALNNIYEGSGVEKYKLFLKAETDELEKLCKCDDLYELYKLAHTFTFNRLPSASKGCDEELKETCKGIRDAYKKYLTLIAPRDEEYGPEGEDDFYLGGRISSGDAAYINRQVALIVRITKRFAEVLDAEKKKRNIASFADIEHMALDILVERRGGASYLTRTAEELKEFYDEILTDEYQDSNELQEAILNAVATDKNRYMVGDVKQSIYRFRGGEPGIFLDKYDKYGKESLAGERIILQNNFRSRAGVLLGCNAVFSGIMNKDYTGISYDESERLVPSFDFANYEKPEVTFAGENGRISCDVIICDSDEPRDKEYLEALRIAEIIKGLFKEGKKVYDTKRKEYRDISFRDIVVLCRRVSTGAAIAEALNELDIPAFAESRSSYMDTYEIRPVISFLKVIDNPLDDVAFSALMLSFFGGFNADEMALLRAADKDEFFYRTLLNSGALVDEALKDKADKFLDMLHDIRRESAHLSVYDLLWRIIYETGYYSYVGSMPAAKRRLANIDLLLSRAFMYTGTSYNGLFQFLRYVEKLEETDKAKGEISAVSELQDVVRVMTIHKSKGLEFPVVFLAGAGKRINLKDSMDSEKMVINGDCLITDVYDTSRKVKRITAFKRSVQADIKRQSVSEEIRLLYVTMTRAVEKLYITGTYGSPSGGSIQKAAGEAAFFKAMGYYGFCDLEQAGSYLKLLLPVILRNGEEGGRLFETNEIQSCDLTDPELKPFDTGEIEGIPTAGRGKAGDKFLSFVYPFEDEIYMKPKVTVTELKKMSYEDEAEKALDYRESYGETDGENGENEYESFSSFNELTVATAAGRGTLYHKLLEHVDLSECSDERSVSALIKKLISEGILQQEAEKLIRPGDIVSLAGSDIGKRAAAALAAGKGKREQQFMFSEKTEGRSDELLVQGVIDLWIEEEDGLLVVDYKTDRVSKRGGEAVLKKSYAKQLEIYAGALERATGKKVKGCIIYSFALGKAIAL